jgi:alanine-synthesizing transaminase
MSGSASTHSGGLRRHELRRIDSMPPYVFAEIDELKRDLRRAGEDVIDLGFGNPDLSSPDVAVAKLCEAAMVGRNHRYSASRGIPNLRRAICERYRERYGVELDPESEALVTVGAKEGFCHLMWVLVEHGDDVLVPTPSYPIHRFASSFAGATVRRVPVAPPSELLAALGDSLAAATRKPRVLVCSFPHNPTTAVVDLDFMQRLVDLAHEHELLVVHDFAYADLAFDGHEPPSILQADGAREVAVELYSLTKGFSMAGWRVGFLVGNAQIVQALARLKSYLDYGTFQPIQIAAIATLNEASGFPESVRAIYKGRRDALCTGLARSGWEVPTPKGTMFVWSEIPESHRALGSLEFCRLLATEAKVMVSPGEGFGPGGEGHVRFALVENEERIRQAVRGIGRALRTSLTY